MTDTYDLPPSEDLAGASTEPSDRRGATRSSVDAAARNVAARTRRDVLRASGAALAGAGLTGATGTATAAGVTIAPLARDGNLVVDPQGEQVTLRGTKIADPGEQSRGWRGMDALEVLEMATAHPEWHNALVRVPIQPGFAAAGTAAGSGPAPADLPHGDEWGPALPGTFDEATLEDYLDAVIDPLVARAETNGAYLLLTYDRHYPVFHHQEHEGYVRDGQPVEDAAYDDLAEVWDCEAGGAVDHSVLEQSDGYDAFLERERHPDVCGERGPLWHAEYQKDPLFSLAAEQEPWTFDASQNFSSIDDVYFEPDVLCNALDAEVRTFWTVVADRYADADHVLFDVYYQPTGPYAGDWGAPDRNAGELALLDLDDDRFEPGGEYARPYYELWIERSQPWMDVAENYGQGQIQLIGNPRWSQYVGWAPLDEYDTENVCYSAVVHLQDHCRPLEETVGCAAEYVPVFFEFGWMDHDLYVPTPWMTREQAGLNWAEGDTDPTSGMSFGRFLAEFDVHPICGAFDHTWRPNFFDHGTPGVPGNGARGSDHWHDDGHLLEEATPGEWWRSYLADHPTEVRAGTSPYSGDTGPNELDGTSATIDVDGCYWHPPPPRCSGEQPTRSVDGQTVCDVDGDTLYEDVTGDGALGQDDVVHFFEHQHRSAWQQPELFDFSENGSVGHGDVVALFEEVVVG